MPSLGSFVSVVRWLRLCRPAPVLVVAAVAFAGVLVLKVLHNEPYDGTSFLLVLPIMLLAVRFGRWAGLAAAAIALTLFVTWALVLTPMLPISPIAYATRATVFVLIGFALFWYVELVRMARDAAYASEERYRFLVENSPHAIIVFDVNTGSLSYVNPRAMVLFGTSRARLTQLWSTGLGSPWQPDNQSPFEAMQQKIRQAANGGSPLVFEWIFRNADGQDLPCEVRLARLPHSTQTLVQASVTTKPAVQYQNTATVPVVVNQQGP